MVYNGNPYYNGRFGGKPTIFGNTHMEDPKEKRHIFFFDNGSLESGKEDGCLTVYLGGFPQFPYGFFSYHSLTKGFLRNGVEKLHFTRSKDVEGNFVLQSQSWNSPLSNRLAFRYIYIPWKSTTICKDSGPSLLADEDDKLLLQKWWVSEFLNMWVSWWWNKGLPRSYLCN